MDPAARFRRIAGLSTLALAALMVVTTVLFFAGSGFDPRTVDEPARLLGAGSYTVETLRWALIADMLVYLLSIPLFICVGSELARERGPGAYALATAGVLYSLVGAVTATVYAYAGPPLLHAYAAAAPGHRAGIGLAFTTLTEVIYRGLWQTLELIPLGVWAIGTGLMIRGRRRLLGNLGVAGGAGALLTSLGRMTQLPTAYVVPFLGLFALSALFQIWLGVILLRNPDGL